MKLKKWFPVLLVLWPLQTSDYLESLLDPEAEEGESAACEFSSWPLDPGTDFTRVGLSWCPVSVDFQVRVHALQSAGAYCAIEHGTSSTTAQIAARHAEINSACDVLDAYENQRVGAGFPGPTCVCPSGYRP